MSALNGQQSLAQIMAQIDSYLFAQNQDSANSYPNTTMILAAVNKWYKRFVGSELWQWATCEGTITTVQGTQRLTMPNSMHRPENFNIRTLSINIPIKTRQSFLANYPAGWNNTGQGLPIMAVEAIPAANNARQYDLWPIPNAAYTINYDGFLYVTPLVNGTDYSIIPPDYDDILIHGPLSELLKMQANPIDDADYHAAEAEKIRIRAWTENENMITTLNQMRGYDANTSNALIYPYHNDGQ